jgi:hypothetical protein
MAGLGSLATAAGYTLGQNDCWIAACCVGHGLPLLTRNRSTPSHWNRWACCCSEAGAYGSWEGGAVRRQRAMVVVTMAKPKPRSSMGAQTMRGPRISAGL